jgi:hypothetical protein
MITAEVAASAAEKADSCTEQTNRPARGYEIRCKLPCTTGAESPAVVTQFHVQVSGARGV